MGYGGTMFRRGAKGQKVRYQSFQLLGDHGHHKEGVLMFHSGDGSNGKYGHGPVFCFVSVMSNEGYFDSAAGPPISNLDPEHLQMCIMHTTVQECSSTIVVVHNTRVCPKSSFAKEPSLTHKMVSTTRIERTM